MFEVVLDYQSNTFFYFYEHTNKTTMRRCKVYLPKKIGIRRFSFEESQLESLMILLAKFAPFACFYIKYMDDEGDWISCNSETEWQECLQTLQCATTLKLKIEHAQQPLCLQSIFDACIMNSNEQNNSTKNDPLQDCNFVFCHDDVDNCPFLAELKQLQNMGFSDDSLNRNLLQQFDGNVREVMNNYLH